MFNGIMKAVGWPLGWIMWLMYQVVSNYGVALILFTLVTKLLLVPLAVKQQKSNIKMQQIQPKIQELQDKYKNNPNKLNEEVQALYQRENYSMFAGCLPTLIQFPILFGLIDVVYNPLTHLLRLGADTVTALAAILTEHGVAMTGYTREIVILNSLKVHPDWFAGLGTDLVAHASSLNMTFLGLDLSVIPNSIISWSPSTWLTPMMLVPLLSGGTALLISLLSLRSTPSGAGGQTTAMMLMMPLMSLFFTFTVPAGVGVYWILSNVFSGVQTFIMNKVWNPKEIAEKMKAEEEQRRTQEREEKIEAKKRAKELGAAAAEEALSQKEQSRRKLAEARQRMAEKYGDEYAEVTDEDLK